MIFLVDFDDTVVEEDHPYDDLESPLTLKPGAREGLQSLKRAGHILVLWSGRNNRARMFLPELDPLVRAGVVGDAQTDETKELHANRWRQMIEFVERELPGIFDAIDDGRQGKPTADLFIDDRAVKFGGATGETWASIAATFGE